MVTGLLRQGNPFKRATHQRSADATLTLEKWVQSAHGVKIASQVQQEINQMDTPNNPQGTVNDAAKAAADAAANLQQKAADAAASVQHSAADAAANVQHKAAEVGGQAKDTVEQAAMQARETASQVGADAARAAADARRAMRDNAYTAKEKASDALLSAAETLRQEAAKGGNEEMIRQSQGLARGMEKAALYLDSHTLDQVNEDASSVVRQNVWQTLGVVFVVGLLLGLLLGNEDRR